jgi:hypothetical protein
MTRQFHKAVRFLQQRSPARIPGEHTLSFICYRIVPFIDRRTGVHGLDAVELCDPQNAMRALLITPHG